MAGGDRRLELVAPGAAEAQCALDEPDALVDEGAIPLRPVLVGEANDVARRVDVRRSAGVGEQEQTQQPDDLRLVGHQLGEQTGEANRLCATLGAHVLGTGRGVVAFGEQQVHRGQHGGQQQYATVRKAT